MSAQSPERTDPGGDIRRLLLFFGGLVDRLVKRSLLLALSLALLIPLAGCRSAAPDVRPVAAAQVATPVVTPGPRKPPALVRMPSVKGKAVGAAKKQLDSAGFDTRLHWTRNPATWGRVIAQKPAGGGAPKGATVVLTVSLGSRPRSTQQPDTTSGGGTTVEDAAARAFQQHQSGVSVSGSGSVSKILADDVSGGRHQRFILRLPSGQTVLVAHNIDIAPRLPSLGPGDAVAFKGIYEWNSQGGVVHWTHHDPSGQHPAGWLKYRGVTYQ
jgi:hypothetical protein